MTHITRIEVSTSGLFRAKCVCGWAGQDHDENESLDYALDECTAHETRPEQ
jgi:hypothetical protein